MEKDSSTKYVPVANCEYYGNFVLFLFVCIEYYYVLFVLFF